MPSIRMAFARLTGRALDSLLPQFSGQPRDPREVQFSWNLDFFVPAQGVSISRLSRNVVHVESITLELLPYTRLVPS